jgi:DNA polymerase I-like protein with 3'-5' exonuclease and polymerase domains
MLWGTFNGYKVGLVQNLSDLDYIRADLHANIIAGFDSETTGLSFVRDRVVGVCIATGKTYSKDDYCGYYIPIRHVGYHANLPVDLVIAFVQYVVDNYMTMWWNRSFDFSMLELDGFKAPFVGKTHDVQFMAHEIFNERYPKLKVFAKRLFGFKTIDFEANNADNGNFGSTDPEVSFIYAAADPLITTLCGLRIWSDYPHIRQIYPLDNESGEAVRRLAKADILLDYDFLDQEVIRTSARMEDVRQRIYQLVGYVFNISSEDDKADALSRFVTLTVRTKSGKFKTDKNVLATIDHPLAKLMLEYNALSTYLKSFVSKMASWRHRQIPVHINYNLVVALTGRMSSSGSEGNDFYVPFNGQNCVRGSNTTVFTRSGSKLISEVVVGDEVWDGAAFRRVSAVLDQGVREIYRLTLEDGRFLDATSDHPVLTASGFREVSTLLGVDVLVSENPHVFLTGVDCGPARYLCRVVSILPIGSDRVYDITVDVSERFVANGIIVHNCPKVSLKMYLHTDPLIGYCLKHEAEGAVCDESGKPIKYKTKGGLRDAFLANPPGEDDWVMVGNDYASEEIALVANMSREEGFLYPLRHDLDVHMYVAETRFHVSDPEFRDKSKAVSFGKIYGGGPTMIANRLNISKQEANKIIYDYDTGMPVFARWQKALQKQAKRTGFAKTFFGRTIYLARWFNSPDNGLRAYADRVALNSPIQGSLPRSLYSPSQDGKVYSPWQSFVGHRMTFQTRSDGARVGVPTFRGEHDLHVALFDTGDFCVCNLGHKFVKYGTDRVLLGLDEIGTSPVALIPPMRKSKWGWLKGLFSGHKWTLESLLAHGKMGRDIRTDDWAIYWCMLKAFLMRKRVHTRSILSAMILRSICDLFGWNLVYDLRHSVVDDYAFKLRWGRRRKGHAIFATELGVRDNVISPSMSSGLQTYPMCGFVHKNTGGDLIRRDLVKFERLNDLLPEWRENVRFVVTVHDEVQFRVRRKYLFKAIPIIQKVMNFWPKNFETPVVVEPGVGFRWGGELDIDGVLDDGRIVPKGYMPPPEYFEGHDVYWLRSWKEGKEKKRGLSKK